MKITFTKCLCDFLFQRCFFFSQAEPLCVVQFRKICKLKGTLNFPRSERFSTIHPFCDSTKAGQRQKEVINQVNGKLINGIIFVDHQISEHCDTKLSKMSHCHISCQWHECMCVCAVLQMLVHIQYA